jgi:serine/threonine protein phosphatase PrpC
MPTEQEQVLASLQRKLWSSVERESMDVLWANGPVAASTVGLSREVNQDFIGCARFHCKTLSSSPLFVAMVCDGMGGMVAGSECAVLAISAILTNIVYSETSSLRLCLRTAVDEANKEIFDRYRGNGGTTLVGIAVTSEESLAFSVGDSRIYGISPLNQTKQLTIDDSIAGQIAHIKGQELNLVELEPWSRQLTQFLGIGSELEIHTHNLNSAYDRYLLTSDGAHTLPSIVLNEIIKNANSGREAIQRLIQLSKWLGGYDNATAIYLPHDKDLLLAGSIDGILEFWDGRGKLELQIERGPKVLADLNVDPDSSMPGNSDSSPDRKENSFTRPSNFSRTRPKPGSNKFKRQKDLEFETPLAVPESNIERDADQDEDLDPDTMVLPSQEYGDR